MPFPLAHPAAVLPLRRFCPRWLSFPALVAGSLSPDTGYGFARYGIADFAHDFTGSFVYCLPAGLVIFACGYAAYHLARRYAPAPAKALLPHPIHFGAPLAILFSILVGAWTHSLWDAFTHKGGWVVDHVPLLQTPVLLAAGHWLHAYHFLWYFFSFAGVAWLCFAYEKWMWGPAERTPTEAWLNPLVAGILILPISAVHHLLRAPFGNLLAAFLTAAVIGWLALRISIARTKLGA
jgi:hypothetical protein